MTETSHTESFEFRAEIQQLLHILAHSLYKEREIFLRELVSNASDALNRLRFQMLTDKDVLDPEAELKIQIDFDEQAKTISVSDTGIGMTRDEMVENLGTIAHSGATQFLRQVADKGVEISADIIGQFGVGFYSVFTVADEVTVTSRSYKPDAEPVRWRSTGDGTYTLEPADRSTRGTQVEVKLKEDAGEFLNAYRLKSIVKKYSDFVAFPIYVNEERANQERALWRVRPQEVSEEQYVEFYKHVTHDFSEPLAHTHLVTDTPVQVYSILYVPSRKDRGLLLSQSEHGLRLYSRKVLIEEHNPDLLPNYLRFIEGVVDSEDLPLNVSREVLQSNRLVATIRRNLVRKVLGALETMAEEDGERYVRFWREFGPFIKEGVATDAADREPLSKLLRFHSSKTEDGEVVSLLEYVARMPEGQPGIYTIFGDDLLSIHHSPHLDPFRARGYEVLYLTDTIDSFMMMGLLEFDGKPIQSVDAANLELPEIPAEAEAQAETVGVPEEQFEVLLTRFRDVLGDKVAEVRAGRLLTDSPCRLVNPEDGIGSGMARVYRLLNEEFQIPKKILEINRSHALVRKLAAMVQQGTETSLADQVIEQLLDDALLVEGIHPNPASMIPRIQALMEAATRQAGQ